MLMKRIVPFFIFCLFFVTTAWSQGESRDADGAPVGRTIRIVEWNVENLFDTRHDTLKNDQDFLPDGSYHWSPFRYWKKINEIGQTLAAIGADDGLPVLVGLCEVENDSVLFDITKRSVLHTAGYEYVMTNSADQRGVDVALMYHPLMFRLLDSHPVRIPSVEHGYSPTRDILYVKGMLPSRDTLHVIVCHLPSKAGGGQSATRHRNLAAETLSCLVDSIMSAQDGEGVRDDAGASRSMARTIRHTGRTPKILVMGDFNATSNEKIFKKLIPPLLETLPTKLSDRMKPVGTYYYQHQWSYLDHILVSASIQEWQGRELRAHEVRLPFLLNEQGTPHRTFRGPAYNGGISDHLPLCLEISLP